MSGLSATHTAHWSLFLRCVEAFIMLLRPGWPLRGCFLDLKSSRPSPFQCAGNVGFFVRRNKAVCGRARGVVCDARAGQAHGGGGDAGGGAGAGLRGRVLRLRQGWGLILHGTACLSMGMGKCCCCMRNGSHTAALNTRACTSKHFRPVHAENGVTRKTRHPSFPHLHCDSEYFWMCRCLGRCAGDPRPGVRAPGLLRQHRRDARVEQGAQGAAGVRAVCHALGTALALEALIMYSPRRPLPCPSWCVDAVPVRKSIIVELYVHWTAARSSRVF